MVLQGRVYNSVSFLGVQLVRGFVRGVRIDFCSFSNGFSGYASRLSGNATTIFIVGGSLNGREVVMKQSYMIVVGYYVRTSSISAKGVWIDSLAET